MTNELFRGYYKKIDARVYLLRVIGTGPTEIEIEVDLTVVNQTKSFIGTVVYSDNKEMFAVGSEIEITPKELLDAYEIFEELNGYPY